MVCVSKSKPSFRSWFSLSITRILGIELGCLPTLGSVSAPAHCGSVCLSVSLTNFLGRNIFYDPICLTDLKGAMDFSAHSAVYMLLAQRWLPSFLQTRPVIRSLVNILFTSWLTHIWSLCLKQVWTYIISDIKQFMLIYNCVYVRTHTHTCMWVPMCHRMYVKIRRWSQELILSCVSWRLNLDSHTWLQVPLPSEPSHQPSPRMQFKNYHLMLELD